jgi:mono/diheme cytochrome c family protein
MRWIALPLFIAFVFVGCGPSAEEQAEAAAAAEQARQDSLAAVAVEAYDPSVFDTITWESPEARMERGQQVYTISCSRCHGPEGLGEGGFVRGGDTLHPPSFRQSDWALAGNPQGIHQAIFVGTAENMPHWGLEGLKAEAIDAVTYYILEGLGQN